MQKVNRIVFSTFAILAASATKHKSLIDKSIEFSDLKSLNKHIKELSTQDDCELYFPFIAKINGEYLLIPNICHII